MRSLGYFSLSLIVFSFGATGEAVSVGPISSSMTKDIVLRTNMQSGEVHQLVNDNWSHLISLESVKTIDPGVDFDGKPTRPKTFAIQETDFHNVAYGYGYRRRYFGPPPPMFYAPPLCESMPPCATPGFLYARPLMPGLDYDVYRRVGPRFAPAVRVTPYRFYRQNGFFYQHFRRW